MQRFSWRLLIMIGTLAGLSGRAGAENVVDCSQPSQCPAIEIIGDAPSRVPTFTGYADPSIVADPFNPNGFWLAYSYLTGKRAKGAWGQTVGVPHVATHLARSTDSGKT